MGILSGVSIMKKIEFSNGLHTIVDDEDFAWLSEYTWWSDLKKNGLRYAYTKVYRANGIRTSMPMSRMILGVISKRLVVDHINCNSLDNRRENLRICTYRQNQQNRRSMFRSSRYPGVSYDKNTGKFRTSISVDRKTFCLGSYSSERDAAIVYESAVRRISGEELVCKMGRCVQ